MSKPSFSNIDLWLFEYAEGNLTDDQVAKLELFILQHPELDVDRDMWEMAYVPATAVAFDGEASLIKRKPVGIYWSFGIGTAAMFALLFIGYAFFLQDDTLEKNLNQLTAVEQSSKKYTTNLVQEATNERILKQEVADLRVLVASLENELYGRRGNSVDKNQIAFNTNFDNNTEQTGIDNGNFRELRALGNEEVAAITGTSVRQFIAANTNVTVTPTSTEFVADVLEDQDDRAVFGNDVEHLNSIKPNVLQEVVMDLQPVSRDIFVLNEVDNSGDQVVKTTNRNATLSVDYEDSYKYKLSRFVRNVRRMANNPIALRNYRDAYHNVPGMISTDLNFGATGTMIAPRFQAMSRLQNRGAANELFSNHIGFDGYVFGIRGGVGVQLTQNYYNQGGIQSSEVAITYSPKFSVNQKLSIEPAFRFKMGNKILNSDRMEGATHVEYIPGNAIGYYDDGTTPVGNMLWYRDLGLGLNVNTEWFYASAQADNIFRHRDNIYSNNLNEKRRAGTYFVATLGTDWESNDSQWETQRARFSISPYLVYRNFENINELWAGANFRAYWLTMGVAVSSNMDPSASLGMVSSDKRFSLMYNADYSRSIVTNERSLSHQVTLRLVGKQSRVGRRH